MKPARGLYRYCRDGRAQDVLEPWQVVPDGDALVLTGRRIVGGRTLLDVLAAWRDGSCQSLRAAWQPGTGASREVQFELGDGQLQWREAQAPPRVEVVPADTLLFPLLRAATGALLPRLLQGSRCVVLPDIRDAQAPGFLRPLRSQRRAEPGRDGPRHFRYYGGEYGESGADYWLDADGFVARYRWESAHGVWEAVRE